MKEFENFIKAIFGEKELNDLYTEIKNNDDAKEEHCCGGECKCNNSSNTYGGYRSKNVKDNDVYKGVNLSFAVPGLSKEDIIVSVSNNIIHVSAKKEAFIFGKLDTKIKIGFKVIPENVFCKYSNGMLTIDVIKEEEKKETNTFINID